MSKIVTPGPGDDQIAELDILIEKDQLCVAGVWNWHENRRQHGLYFIYLKQGRIGFPFSPHYASFALAERDMLKILKAFPRGFWDQPIDWIASQKSFREWVFKNIGKPGDLIGGQWVKASEEKKS